MLTFEGGINLRKIDADGFVTVTLHQLKDNLSKNVIQISKSHVFMSSHSRVICVLFRAVLRWSL